MYIYMFHNGAGARRAVTGIALSGFGRDEDIRRSREAGFAGHLTKPIDLRRREAMIRQVAS
jgi:CheY-like chemotaxis protein